MYTASGHFRLFCFFDRCVVCATLTCRSTANLLQIWLASACSFQHAVADRSLYVRSQWKADVETKDLKAWSRL